MARTAHAHGWAQRLEAAWWGTQPPAWYWRALASLFGSLAWLRRRLYQRRWLHSERLDVPVIVIGNRIVGGAGKTPTLLALIEALRDAGWHPGVVSRGHGRQGDASAAVLASSDAASVGDEPLLIARRSGVPVWVGRDRVAAARALRRTHPEVDVLLCDDGLQHLRLARDLELIVFDERGAGNGYLLPAGPLREPIDAPSLASHHWVLYNATRPTTRLPGELAQRSLAAPVALADWHTGQPRALAWSELAQQPVWALAGIGAPQRFFVDLQAQGLQLPSKQQLPMADHAAYEQLPWPMSVKDLLVTEKDAVKLTPARLSAQRPHTRVWVVALRYTLPPTLVKQLLAQLGQLKPRQAS